MHAVILAAGRSKRIKPIEDKNFLKFLGKTLIEHQIENVRNAGFEKITVIGGAHNLEKLQQLDVQVVEQENLDEGMAGAMMSLESHLQDEEILLLSANDYLDPEAFELMKNAASQSSAACLMLAKKVTSYFPGGYIAVEENRITEIVEKPGEGNEPSDMINIVLHWHKKPLEFIAKIRESNPNGRAADRPAPYKLSRFRQRRNINRDDWYEVAIDNMIKSGTPVEAVPYEGYWQALKYPWHVLELQKHFLSQIKEPQIADSAEIAETATVNGPVIIEEDVRVFDHATIQGPAYIDKNAVIATNALVRDSIVGENTVVGYSSEVARSHLENDIWLHTNYIGDSILCENVALGAGAVTGNLRLDEAEISMNIKDQKTPTQTKKFGTIIGANSRIGINASIMPGIKIGRGVFIGGGLPIGQDIPDNSFVKGKVDLEIRENRTGAKRRSKLK